MYEVRIDAEFQKLLPPLADDELAELRSSIEDEGIREPFVVWQETGILLDGHNRHSIAQGLGQPWPTPRELSFADRDAARRWVIVNQLGRRNLDPNARAYLRGKMVQAAPRDVGGRPAETAETVSAVSTPLQELAERDGVTDRTLRNDAKFAEAVDSVAENVGDDFRDHALKPRTHTTRKEVMEISRLDPDEQREVVAKVRAGAKVKDARSEFKREQKLREAEKAKAEQSGARPFEVRRGDFRQALADIADESAALVFTDPPWDDATLIETWPDLLALAERILVPGGSLISYAGHNALPFMLSTPTELRYWWMLSMVLPSGKRLPGKFVMAEWRPLVWYVNGSRMTNEFLPDVARRESKSLEHKGWHEWAQTPEMPTSCIDRLTKAGALIVDPFTGGGTTGAAAVSMGRRFVGAELDDQSAVIAEGRLEQVWRDVAKASK